MPVLSVCITMQAGCDVGCGLEYVEEPVQHCSDLPQFYALTGKRSSDENCVAQAGR